MAAIPGAGKNGEKYNNISDMSQTLGDIWPLLFHST